MGCYYLIEFNIQISDISSFLVKWNNRTYINPETVFSFYHNSNIDIYDIFNNEYNNYLLDTKSNGIEYQ